MGSSPHIPAGHSASISWPRGWSPTDKTIHRTFTTGSFTRGVSFVDAIAPLAETMNHHPDIILSYPCVIVTLTTHEKSRVTDKDLRLAEQINDLWDRLAA